MTQEEELKNLKVQMKKLTGELELAKENLDKSKLVMAKEAQAKQKLVEKLEEAGQGLEELKRTQGLYGASQARCSQLTEIITKLTKDLTQSKTDLVAAQRSGKQVLIVAQEAERAVVARVEELTGETGRLGEAVKKAEERASSSEAQVVRLTDDLKKVRADLTDSQVLLRAQKDALKAYRDVVQNVLSATQSVHPSFVALRKADLAVELNRLNTLL